jgi:hypothetical protein
MMQSMPRRRRVSGAGRGFPRSAAGAWRVQGVAAVRALDDDVDARIDLSNSG